MSTEELDLMRDPFEELGHLRKLAKADPTKRFDMLYRLVCHPEVLAVAAERVREKTGCRRAGIDGQTRKQINAELLTHLAEDLTQHRYGPQAVRRVYIPKGLFCSSSIRHTRWAAHYPSFQAMFGIPWVLLLVDRE